MYYIRVKGIQRPEEPDHGGRRKAPLFADEMDGYALVLYHLLQMVVLRFAVNTEYFCIKYCAVHTCSKLR